MKLNVSAFAIAHAVTAAIVYVFCALLVMLSPETAIRLAAYAFHADLSGIMRPVNVSGFVVGLLVVSIGWGVLSLIMASVYNSLAKSAASTEAHNTV